MSIPHAFKPLGVTSGDKFPAGYTKLDYISTDGSQFINTGYNLAYKGGYIFDADVYFTQGTASYICFQRDPVIGLHYRWGSQFVIQRTNTLTSSAPNIYERWVNIYCSLTDVKGLIRVDGTTIYESDAYVAFPTSGWTSPFCVFNNKVTTINGHVKMKKIDVFDKHGDIVFKFRPALDPNGRPCLFDFVRQKPFYNSGTGEFLYA